MKLDVEYIDRRRREKDLGKGEMMRKIGYSDSSSNSMFSKYEKRPSRDMSYKMLLKLAMLLDVVPFELTEEEPGDYDFLGEIE